jgi:hypothetical protein
LPLDADYGCGAVSVSGAGAEVKTTPDILVRSWVLIIFALSSSSSPSSPPPFSPILLISYVFI